jgi:hypothetical protein
VGETEKCVGRGAEGAVGEREEEVEGEEDGDWVTWTLLALFTRFVENRNGIGMEAQCGCDCSGVGVRECVTHTCV